MVQKKFNSLMEDPTFVNLTPKERIDSGRFSISLVDTVFVDVTEGLSGQVNPWKAKALLIPMQTYCDHWTLLGFNFNLKKVYVYDSLCYTKVSPQQIGVEKMLPYVVYAANLTSDHVELDINWEREFVPCSRQPDYCACGICILAFVDCILRGKSRMFETKPKPENLRNRVAMDFVDCGVAPTGK